MIGTAGTSVRNVDDEAAVSSRDINSGLLGRGLPARATKIAEVGRGGPAGNFPTVSRPAGPPRGWPSVGREALPFWLCGLARFPAGAAAGPAIKPVVLCTTLTPRPLPLGRTGLQARLPVARVSRPVSQPRGWPSVCALPLWLCGWPVPAAQRRVWPHRVGPLCTTLRPVAPPRRTGLQARLSRGTGLQARRVSPVGWPSCIALPFWLCGLARFPAPQRRVRPHRVGLLCTTLRPAAPPS